MLIILIIFNIIFYVFFDFSNYQSFIDGAKGIDNRDFIFKIIDRLIKSFVYFQSTFKEIVFNNNFDMTYSYGSGLRLSGIVIGIKETIKNNPFLELIWKFKRYLHKFW